MVASTTSLCWDVGVIDWGSVPDWLASTVSVVALVFAFLAVRASHQTNVQQGLQLKVLEDDRSQAQASKVAIWCISGASDIPRCRILNASDLPIYSMIACVAGSDMPPDSELHEDRYDWWWRFRFVRPHIIPPNTSVDVEFDRSGLADGMAMHLNSTAAALYFRDANGKWWRRNVKGRLEENSIKLYEHLERATNAQGNKWNRIDPQTTASDAFEDFASHAR